MLNFILYQNILKGREITKCKFVFLLEKLIYQILLFRSYLKTSFFVPDTKVCTAFLNGTLVSRTKFSGGGCETYF